MSSTPLIQSVRLLVLIFTHSSRILCPCDTMLRSRIGMELVARPAVTLCASWACAAAIVKAAQGPGWSVMADVVRSKGL